MKGVKHHWQKYDYSSSLICQCDLIKEDQKGLENIADLTQTQPLCTIRQIKEVLQTFRTSGKKIKSEPKESSTLEVIEEASETNSDDSTDHPTHSETSHGLSREEKKINYWLRVIDEMEQDKNVPKSTRRGRKPHKNQPYNKEYEPPKSYISTESLNQPNPESVHKKDDDILEKDFHNNSANIGIDNKSDNHNWYISSKISDVLIKNNAIISNLKKCIQNHRRSQIPIKLALRRGLYHLISPNWDSSTASKIANNCNDHPKICSEGIKRSFSEREIDIHNKESTEFSIGKSITSVELPKPKIKKELPPIPELRPTLYPSSKNIPPQGFSSNGLEK
ncbi:hypothetical protein MXB_4799 [Myxobolus squamalis]|nr:hypothetical protein MXB_4799 [Myxobolus squamalis]